MAIKFLQDIVNLDNIQFVNSSGTNAGLINMDGNDLVLSNPLGDILLGDGASDVYIGDGTNNVDILFEQSGSIKADDSASGVTLTLGSSNTTLAFGGNTSFAGVVTAISGTSANAIDLGTNGVPFRNIYAAHHVGGSSINYATSRGWVEDDVPLSSTQAGFYGGDFTRNGDADENAVVRGQDPFNNKALLWKCILHDTDDDADGGWNKNITIPANNNIGYLSYVYFMADFTPDSDTAGSRDGTMYLGCGQTAGQTINISDDSSNTNPYFVSNSLYTVNNGGPVIANRWYLMIGVIQPYNDETTGGDTVSGVYDVETGERVATGSEFKMGNNTTSQVHRAYVYYDESGDAGENVYFWNPGFHAIDGSEPKLQDLLKRQIYVDDNIKAAFGDSHDLQLLHDGSNSYIHHNGGGSLYMKADTGNIQIINYTNDADIVLQSDDGSGGTTPYLTLDGSTTHAHFSNPGNVGIGTTSPSAKLTVSGVANGSSIAEFKNASDIVKAKIGLTSNSSGELTLIDGNNVSNVLLSSRESVNSYINAGNVGIGTTSPGNKLEVHSGTTNVAGVFKSSDNQAWISVQDDDSGTYGALFGTDSDEGHDIVLADRSANKRLVIDSSGNVGVGTTSPGETLDVAGNIAVSGTVDGVDIAARDAVLTSTTTTANAALPKAGGTMTGQLAVNHNGGTLNLVGTDHTYIQWYPAGISGGRHAYTGFAGGGTDHFTIANETSGAHINLTTNSGTVNVTGNLSVTGTIDGVDVGANYANWNTAYGWGDHASAGYLTSLPSHNHDDRYYTETESDARYAALSHNHAASDIVTGTLADGRISESSVTQHEAALTITEGQLPDDMPSDKVKQICTTHHNFFMNSTSTTADFFVPFNNLNESSNPTNAQYYNRMVAPYDGRIVKVVLHTTAAIGTACQVLFWVATSSGTFAPSAAETVTGVNLNTANTSATATFSTTSTAQFSAEDVLGVSIIKSTTATANMQVTVVWEYTL